VYYNFKILAFPEVLKSGYQTELGSLDYRATEDEKHCVGK
jgi:hypothetical protein